MSEVFIAWEPAPADTVFAQGAFDGQVGRVIRVKLPGGREVDGVIRSAMVIEDGSGAQVLVEVPDGTLPRQSVAGYSIADG
jgi:hypothetical protein